MSKKNLILPYLLISKFLSNEKSGIGKEGMITLEKDFSMLGWEGAYLNQLGRIAKGYNRFMFIYKGIKCDPNLHKNRY